MHLLLKKIVDIAKHAGSEILSIYHRMEKIAVQTKKDQSPLTEADLTAHQLITEKLSALTPKWPILSEESPLIPFTQRSQWDRYWLIDPLDGTKEFINRTDEFSVNIALIAENKPILGVVYAPVLDLCYYAATQEGAYRQHAGNPAEKLHTRTYDGGPITVVASRSHGLNQLHRFLSQLGDHSILHRGSALKCGLIAEGVADVYPRFSPTSEWDIAAGQCVIEEAGGKLFDLNGEPLRYNCKESLINPSFLAVGDVRWNWRQYL